LRSKGELVAELEKLHFDQPEYFSAFHDSNNPSTDMVFRSYCTKGMA
jgi:hypothetical protein